MYLINKDMEDHPDMFRSYYQAVLLRDRAVILKNDSDVTDAALFALKTWLKNFQEAESNIRSGNPNHEVVMYKATRFLFHVTLLQ